jgi:tetratricopeptide (TPR) repeat protein
LIACLIAIDSHIKSRPLLMSKPKPLVKILASASLLVTSWAYLNYVFAPVASSTFRIRQANMAFSSGRFEYAHRLLEKAASADVLSSAALSLNGRLYLREYEITLGKNRDLLLHAETCLQSAIGRNNAPFKNFERLTDVYNQLAEILTGQDKADWLNNAFEAASQAIERYPGCGRLHFKQAQIADKMGNVEIAIDQYKKAIEIEDEYRAQFRLLYPEREEIVSRIDKKMYLDAKKRIVELSGKSNN